MRGVHVDQVVERDRAVQVKSVSGPIKVAGAYGSRRALDGVTNVWTTTKAASLAKLPPLGPSALPVDKRRHFFTPFDLMMFGFNPVLPAYPVAGRRRGGRNRGRDFPVLRRQRQSQIVGVQTVKVPAGTFKALVVRVNAHAAGLHVRQRHAYDAGSRRARVS